LEQRKAYRIFVGKPEGKNHQEDLNVGERIILKWTLEKQDGVVLARFFWPTIGIIGRLL
jgi:hypothetical protein